MSGSVTEVEVALPAQYLQTGDKALIVAWVVLHRELSAVLVLEDGKCVIARTDEFTFDYRYDNNDQKWVDVSVIRDGESNADTDQEDADHGGPEVPGLVLDADGAGEGDPGDG